MKIVIDDEKIIDLVETEWGYEGIREDIARVIRENGTPLEDIKTEITDMWKDEPCAIEFGCLNEVLEVIDKHIGDTET